MRMNDKNQFRIGLLPMVAVFLAAAGSLFSQRADAGSEEDEYVPGTSTIEEAGILERMERELRSEFTPAAPTERDGGPTQKKEVRAAKKNHDYRVTLSLQDNTSVSGSVTLVQHLVEIRDPAETLHRIPLSDVRSLEFSDWKTLRSVRASGSGPVREFLAPTACRIVKKDGEEIRGQCDVNDFLQLNLRTPDSFGRYRIYYTRTAGDSKTDGPAPVSNPAASPENATAEGAEEPAAEQPAAGTAPPAAVVTTLQFLDAGNDGTAENRNTNGDEETASAPLR